MSHPRSLPQPPAREPCSQPPADSREELIDNLALLVVRQHRRLSRHVLIATALNTAQNSANVPGTAVP
jgi:hypothetical protein